MSLTAPSRRHFLAAAITSRCNFAASLLIVRQLPRSCLALLPSLIVYAVRYVWDSAPPGSSQLLPHLRCACRTGCLTDVYRMFLNRPLGKLAPLGMRLPALCSGAFSWTRTHCHASLHRLFCFATARPEHYVAPTQRRCCPCAQAASRRHWVYSTYHAVWVCAPSAVACAARRTP